MRTTLAISTVVAGIFSQWAMAAGSLPDRCAYVYAAATYNVAFMIHKQVTELGDPDATQRAHIAVQLTRNLECPVEPMLEAVDCAVALIRQQGGGEATQPQVVGCVSEAMGRAFPRLSERVRDPASASDPAAEGCRD